MRTRPPRPAPVGTGRGPAGTRGGDPGDTTSDRGAVTVEGAIALSATVLVFGVLLAGVSAVLDTVRCTDAAVAAAGLLARGDRDAATRAARTLAPDRATVETRYPGSTVVVTVRTGAVGGLLPGVTVEGVAHAWLEPGVRPRGAGDAPR